MRQSKNDVAKFATFMKAFEINCSVPEITKDQLNLYFTVLKQFPMEEVAKAFTKVMYDWIYNRMPAVGVFVKAIESQQPAIEALAAIQATEVLCQIRQRGASWQPNFDDKITTWLMEKRFPWSALCSNMKESEEKWFVKDFIEAYRVVSNNKTDLLITDSPEKLTQITNNLFKDTEKEIGWTHTKKA
ncbi:MAG: hypothetical protein JRG81_00270 [Deltaproteobacteria bacterium]|nr:hypothetical protein [Deltaproteobacteria bacterium]MBW2363513.1 hypothetical protein [Deltaproteobacteria bacterium]